MGRLGKLIFSGLLGAGSVLSCAANGVETDRSSLDSCTPGETAGCACDGGKGIRSCSGGTFGTCVCNRGFTNGDAPGTCGDGQCSGGETCKSCPRDCLECPHCDLAPTCTGAEGTPTSSKPRPDLNITNASTPNSSTPATTFQTSSDCGDPQLRIRVQSVKAYKGGGQIYCVINASDGIASEVAITAKTKSLKDGEVFFFDPSVGVFWGQKALHPTNSNLTVTYNCFRVQSDAWAKVFKAAADASATAGGYAGLWGWAFGVGAIGATIAATALSAGDGDNLLFNAQQVIDRHGMTDLANARLWTVRRGEGTSWDWELTVQAWGCADGRLSPN